MRSIFPGRPLTRQEKARRFADRHPGADAARARARHAAGADLEIRQRFADLHPGYDAERARRRRQANPSIVLEVERRYRRKHPEAVQAKDLRRREASFVWERLAPWPTQCQVCGRTIDLSIPFPDQRAATLGHEPPIAWMQRHPEYAGALFVRPEHWICNLSKGDKPDWELLKGAVT
jgi:hypothetical protein